MGDFLIMCIYIGQRAVGSCGPLDFLISSEIYKRRALQVEMYDP